MVLVGLVLICYIRYVGDNMKKKNGFTLIELLAVLVIIALLLLVAVPSVSSLINQSRKETFIANAKAYIKIFRTELLSRQYVVDGNESEVCWIPPVGKYVSISLSEIDLEKEDGKTPWGLEYWDIFSYVVVKNKPTAAAPVGSNKAGKLVYYFIGYDKEHNGIKYLVEESKLHTKFVEVNGKGGVSYSAFLESEGLASDSSTSYNQPVDTNVRQQRKLYLYEDGMQYSNYYTCVRKD